MNDDEQDKLLMEIAQAIYEVKFGEGFWNRVINKCDYLQQAEVALAKLKAMGYEQVWKKCPDCKGTRQVKPMFSTPELMPCPKCNCTGKIPKYVKGDREKIARIICCFAKDNNSCAECKQNIPPNLVFPDCFNDIREETDKLLALIPDIEEVRMYYKEIIGSQTLLIDELETRIEEAKKQERDKWLEFVDWLDNGLRSSAGWRAEIRKFAKSLKEESNE